MNYLALGDSISIDDYTDVEGGGAVSQFARLIQAAHVEDLTRDGQTTDGVLAALARVSLRPDVVTLTAGGNDLLHATFRYAPSPSELGPGHWRGLALPPLANLRTLADRVALWNCPVILNTIYDPTDGDNSLSAQIGLSVEARQTFDSCNAGIKALAQEYGFLLADLEILFHGHGLSSPDPWFVMNIEPNYEGATAIARHWFHLLQSNGEFAAKE